MLRGHAGEHREFFNVLFQHLLGHKIQLLAGNRQVSGAADVQLLGNGHGGDPVVPGNHPRPDPCLVAPLHRPPDLLPGRVRQAEQPQKGQLLFQRGTDFP